MSKTVKNLQLGLDENLEEKLQWMVPNYSSYHILRQSVDARRGRDTQLIYSVEIFEEGEKAPENNYPLEKVNYTGPSPIIIGAGPAGLFCALRLTERGIPCHLFERGSQAEKRVMKINRFWRYGELDSEDNVCFGEGGAGLYSDGKLITRIKSPHIPYVLHRLVKFGAPAEIQYLANPHVGSDRIRRLIPKIRDYLQANGVSIHFNTRIDEILCQGKQITGVRTQRGDEYRSDQVILASGHSADDVFTHLDQLGVDMEGKSFAVGLRVEHPQKLINEIQYRENSEHPKLGAANYKLTHHDNKQDIGVYSFCMCPGGYVLSSGTNNKGVVCNGMSNYRRNSPFANAALVVSVDFESNFANQGKFAGLEFRNSLEARALEMVKKAGGSKELPVQKLTDFLADKAGEALPSSSPSGAVASHLHELLPDNLKQAFTKGLQGFDNKMKGFVAEQAQLHGVESRTSCPVRITRDKQSLQSTSHPGLYPTGEGAGYAGGITSAACDGIRVAEAIVSLVTSSQLEPST